MKKNCIICGREVETKVDYSTKVFIVNFEPCICSDCTMELFDTFCEKDSNLSQYKEIWINILKSLVMNYPDEWDDCMEDFLVADVMKLKKLIGENITENDAVAIVQNLKRTIDNNPEKYSDLRKNRRLESVQNDTEQENSDVSVSTQLAVFQMVDEGSTQDRREKFRNIVNEVKAYIRGQDEAVEAIGCLFFHNDQCVEYNQSRFTGAKISKENMILVGPTGTGKTATITEYCRLLGLPYVIADMTAYTQAGFVGGNVEDIFQRLIKAADGDIDLAQRGIVIMDESDKNEAKTGESTIDVGGKGLIDSLLKKIEGTEIDLGKGKIFNSTNTTFIAMGVYPRLYDIRKERILGKRSIGFSTSVESDRDLGEFIAADFVKHGFTDEYVARFSNIVELKTLSDAEYLDILRNSKNSVYKQYKALFEYSFGIELIITPDGELSIIEMAKTYNTGARGLNRSVSKILKDVEKRIMLGNIEVQKIIIDKGCEIKML